MNLELSRTYSHIWWSACNMNTLVHMYVSVCYNANVRDHAHKLKCCGHSWFPPYLYAKFTIRRPLCHYLALGREKKLYLRTFTCNISHITLSVLVFVHGPESRMCSSSYSLVIEVPITCPIWVCSYLFCSVVEILLTVLGAIGWWAERGWRSSSGMWYY